MKCKEIELLLFLVALQLYIYEYPERALKDKKKKFCQFAVSLYSTDMSGVS